MGQTVMPEGYDRLLRYLCDMILEEQLKLGYERETIRFYSPVASVSRILFPGGGEAACGARDDGGILPVLQDFCERVGHVLGGVKIRKCSGERICFVIPPEGAAYVHGHQPANPFLAELVACFGGHDVTPERVRGLFEAWSAKARCERPGGDEFDEVWYFEDGVPDRYRYCVKYDLGHASYHRFLEEDFAELFAQPG